MIRSKITHVAIRFQGVIYSLPAPNRHHDVIRHIVQTTGVSHVDSLGDDQGFLDENGRYLRRPQAKLSAKVNGQIIDGRGIHHDLYSEDVW